MPYKGLSIAVIVAVGIACGATGAAASTPDLSVATEATLQARGLLGDVRHHPDRVAETLRVAVESGNDPRALLALSEVCYLAGLRGEHLHLSRSLSWFRDSAVYASFALADPARWDACQAESLHDAAVERIMDSVSPSLCKRRSWSEVLRKAGINPTSSVVFLGPDRVDTVDVAANLRVRDMNSYHTREGLGVPIVAKREIDPDAPRDVQDQFYGHDLILPATAIIRPIGALHAGQWRERPVVLDLRDSFNEAAVTVGDRAFPLAANFTAPTALQANRSEVRNLEVLGTFNPIKAREIAGVVMPRPYEPGKIPVVFIHGLASTPSTWLAAYNDLLGDPEIRAKYQLWALRYPPGEPLLVSARLARTTIREACQTLDPVGSDPALRGIIVIGHSIGGILTKAMISDTGDRLWRAWFTRPPEMVATTVANRQKLIDYFFLHPEPTVVRAVMIASPLGGSRGVNTLPGRLASLFIRPDDVFIPIRNQLLADNGRGVFQPDIQPKRINGITALDPESPTLEVLKESPIAPGLPYHTIIAVKNRRSEVPLDKISDGYVTYQSAHLDGAQSELLVHSGHSCLDKPETSAEVRRILHLHLREMELRKAVVKQ